MSFRSRSFQPVYVDGINIDLIKFIVSIEGGIAAKTALSTVISASSTDIDYC